jgi:hypothetical protein
MENLVPSTCKAFSLCYAIIDHNVVPEVVNDSDLEKYEIEDTQNIEDV